MKISLDHMLALTAALAGLLLVAMTAPAAHAEGEQAGRAELINACIQDIRRGLKAGQVLSNSQRMLAEEQCRAYAEAQIEKQRNQPANPPPPASTVEAVKAR
ncbi:hypothetical protein [Ferrovibrio xuzhouensis]|uniref:Conjugative transfer region protein TrbK n=1 Tax=Ferrovibrio xuzhouensis TaxID=1576914 RepID=A0ABV7VAM7_9PROT